MKKEGILSSLRDYLLNSAHHEGATKAQYQNEMGYNQENYHEGCEVEFFAGNGETIAVVSVPTTALRAATRQDVLHVRQLNAA